MIALKVLKVGSNYVTLQLKSFLESPFSYLGFRALLRPHLQSVSTLVSRMDTMFPRSWLPGCWGWLGLDRLVGGPTLLFPPAHFCLPPVSGCALYSSLSPPLPHIVLDRTGLCPKSGESEPNPTAMTSSTIHLYFGE